MSDLPLYKLFVDREIFVDPPFLPAGNSQGAELSARAVVGVVCLAAFVIISDGEHLMGDRVGAQCTFASSISTDMHARRSVE
jgi:hypothetical protein